MSQVFQFKITLCGIKPPIWRRVQVLSTSTYAELSDVIQTAMGWDGYHAHDFIINNQCLSHIDHIFQSIEDIENIDDYAECTEEDDDNEKLTLDAYFSMDNQKAKYVYDFGDNWRHDIKLEKILERDVGQNYPKCIAGKRACPPEDCGGVWGYEDIISMLSNPKKRKDKERLEWLGDFNPEAFDCKYVIFS